jgi:competence protein ComEC
VPFVWLSLAFLSGVFLASLWRVPWVYWLVAALLPISGVLLLRGRSWHWAVFLSRRHMLLKFAPLLLVTFLSAGGLRYTLSLPVVSAAHLIYYNDGGPVRLTGVVSEPPDRQETSTQFILRVETLTNFSGSLPEREVDGRLQVTLAAGADWQTGDRLELTGKPETPPESPDFSEREYLAHRGITTEMKYPHVHLLEHAAQSGLRRTLEALRQKTAGIITQILPHTEAALLTGILLGDDSSLPESVVQTFQISGTAHIIAISGFNMAVLAGLFSTLFRRLLRRYWATLGAILTLVLYTLMVGANAAVVRALIMSILSLVAVQIGRPGGGLNALLLAAGLMCLFSPGLLWDIGFQLSCAATLGLILYAGPLQGAAERLLERRLPSDTARRVAAPLGEYLLFTLAAQAATLPILAYHFQRVSLTALLANPLILPPQPLVMTLGGLAALAGLVWLPLGQLLGWAAWPFLYYSVRIAEIFGGSPGSQWAINSFHPAWLAVYYGLLIGIAFARGWWDRVQAWLKPAVLLAVSAALALLIWHSATNQPDGRLHIYLFNLQGQTAWLVRAPDGQTLLVDGSNSAKALSNVLSRRLPPFQRNLSGWLYTGVESDLGGLGEVFQRYPPQVVLRCAEFPEKKWAETLAATMQDFPDERLVTGQTMNMGEVEAEVVALQETCGLRMSYGRFQAVLEENALRLWMGQALKAPQDGWLHLTTDGKLVWMEED